MFFLTGEGNGYHFPRLPTPAKPGETIVENPGCSIVDAEYRRRVALWSEGPPHEIKQRVHSWRGGFVGVVLFSLALMHAWRKSLSAKQLRLDETPKVPQRHLPARIPQDWEDSDD